MAQQTISQIVAALATSEKCAIVSMRSNKPHFNEILNDYSKSTENDWQTLETDNCKRLVLIVDRSDPTDSGAVKLERRA